MLHTRKPRTTLAALAITVTAALSLPGVSTAQPVLPIAPPGIDLSTIDPAALEILPAIIGSAATGAGNGTEAQDELLATLTRLLGQPDVPPQVQDGARRIVSFISAPEPPQGGPPIPTDGPPIQQFLYPTIGFDCIGPGQSSIATALAVSGPAGIPAPGPRARQAAFVFTALGTGGATSEVPADPLTVSWFNIDSGRSGATKLDNSAGINADGPATYTAISRTGSGRILATIHGQATLQGPNGPITCGFAPTVGIFVVE
ncbi:Rv1157c family protein [Lolliginicoccus suaedae]|uniref:Rv1157c family protein n=1 Tax=Lolliginicoccus suaedae TaxID=2605429 RepID=UPI0011EBE49A|nr:hypothetical protein [Lolliginicoccus suaedae]